MATIYRLQKSLDVGMIGNGAIAALVAITAPSGYVQPWAAIIIGAVAGVIVVFGVIAIDKWIDDPVGALSAHGLAGIWGTLSCGLFTDPQLATFNGVGQGGLFYTGSFKQLGAQAAAVSASFVTVFALSYGLFWAIKKTVGLRVSERHEIDGLDISEHGMWGYPEQFMPVPGGAYVHPDAVAEPAHKLVGSMAPPDEQKVPVTAAGKPWWGPRWSTPSSTPSPVPPAPGRLVTARSSFFPSTMPSASVPARAVTPSCATVNLSAGVTDRRGRALDPTG